MTATPVLSSFAAPARRRRSTIQTICLPSGEVQIRLGIIAHMGSLVGVEFDGKVVLVRWPRTHSTDEPVVQEQLVGWYAANGYRIVRCKGWRPRVRSFATMTAPQNVRRCQLYFVRLHLAELAVRIGPALPAKILMPEAVRHTWAVGALFWREAANLLYGLEETDPALVLEVAPDLALVARRWEFQMVRAEAHARKHEWLEPTDLDLISTCDRSWRTCVSYLPSYVLLSETMARLL